MYADIYHRHGKRRNVSERNRSATGVNGRTARRWAAAEQRQNRAAQPPPIPSRRSGPTDTLPALAGKCPSGSDAFKSVCAPRRTADAQAGTRRKEEPIRKTSRTVVRNERYRKTQSGYGKGITSEKMKRTRIRMFYWSTAAKMLFSKHAVHQHMHSNSTGWLRREP